MAGVALGWLGVLVLVLRLAALPPGASGKLLVLFAPGSAAKPFAAIVTAGGVPVRPVLGGLGWIARPDAPGFVARLEANGALAAYPGAPVGLTLAGCFAFATDPPHPLARTLDPRLAPGPSACVRSDPPTRDRLRCSVPRTARSDGRPDAIPGGRTRGAARSGGPAAPKGPPYWVADAEGPRCSSPSQRSTVGRMPSTIQLDAGGRGDPGCPPG